MVSGGKVQDNGALPGSLRRRITPMGRKVLEAAWAVLDRDASSSRIVLSSRHGEYTRTFGLLTSLAESGEVSPAEFSLSVHHGLAGLLSIVTGNREGHMAVSAGGESFGYGMLEAAISLDDGVGSVLLLHFDEALPDSHAAISDEETGDLALALLLTSEEGGEGERISLDLSPTSMPGNDPLALRFSRLLSAGDMEAAGTGERMIWRWKRGA